MIKTGGMVGLNFRVFHVFDAQKAVLSQLLIDYNIYYEVFKKCVPLVLCVHRCL